MPIEEPSVSLMSMNNEDIMGDLVVVGKHIRPIEFEATNENHDKHID